MKMVTLHDGTEVPSDSEAWRHECEARSIMNMPTLEKRRAHLAAITKIRGQAAADRIRETMSILWPRRSHAQPKVATQHRQSAEPAVSPGEG